MISQAFIISSSKAINRIGDKRIRPEQRYGYVPNHPVVLLPA
jgi:hypothetical protein